MAVPRFIEKVVRDRVKGKRPSAVRALATAAAAGGVTAVLTYKALRT
jgi:hypothetical protein